MAIGEILIEMIGERFPNRGFTPGGPENALGTFPAAHPEVGGITLYDDGDEITVYLDNFTHGHFDQREEHLGKDAERAIASDVIEFLDDLFADRVVVWGSLAGAGGWFLRGGEPSWASSRGKEYVWSGPLE